MSLPVLYITRILPEPVMRAARERYDLLAEPTERAPSDEQRRQGFAAADAVICTLSDRVDAALLAQATRLTISTWRPRGQRGSS
jgi:glyoxylate reductase